MNIPAIAIHGGAGNLTPTNLPEARQEASLNGLRAALDKGMGVLRDGGSALDAVEQAVRLLEDNPLFNAGKGSVYNADGRHEMDACIMDGRGQAGAVAGVQGIRNPIVAARAVMERSAHLMLVGNGAENFARTNGVPFEPLEYFHDELRLQQWKSVSGSKHIQLDHSDPADRKFDTVGAVAVDTHGHLAAATSTGGMTNKMPGRIGDTPLVGAGTYADNDTCAISCTGHGEFFIRGMVAHDVACLMRYRGHSLAEACRIVIHDKLTPPSPPFGVIAVDGTGVPVLDFNTKGMFRGSCAGNDTPFLGIW